MRKLSRINLNLFQATGICENSAYVLGHLWGDGYVTRPNGYYIVGTDINQKDAEDVLKAYSQTGRWNVNTLKRTYKNNKYTRIYTGHREFGENLEKLGFRKKVGSHEKVIKEIPENMRKYFWLGLFDADGSISKDAGHSWCSICSDIRQDWSSLEGFCDENSISYKIKKQRLQTGSASVFVISSRDNAVKFLTLLYSSELGLQRKRKEFVRMLENAEDARQRLARYSIGRRFGKLVILDVQSANYTLRCDCGRTLTGQTTARLRRMNAPHCGCENSAIATARNNRRYKALTKEPKSIS